MLFAERSEKEYHVGGDEVAPSFSISLYQNIGRTTDVIDEQAQ